MSETDSSAMREFIVGPDAVGERLDQFLAKVMSEYSRVQLRRAISDGNVWVNDKLAKPSYRLAESQLVRIEVKDKYATGSKPEEIPLSILYEDDEMVAVNKPPGMVVHPAKGHWSGTLTAALAFHFQNLSKVGGETRPGIVHRLDRDTSGVILIAKNDAAHMALAEQFEKRETEKEYWGLVSPMPDRDRDWIDAPIGVHPYQREKMAIRAHHESSREAQTFFEVVHKYSGIAELKILPKTGRTHQIRVHLTHVGYPILADKLYSGRSQITRRDLFGIKDTEEVLLNRQALHAARIRFRHPSRDEMLEIHAPLPDDLKSFVELLKKREADSKKS